MEKRGGFYWKGDKPYLSVTQILKVIDKPSLRYWMAREVYLAMIKNPNLTEAEAMAVPSLQSNKAILRGKTVHSIIEAYKKSKKNIEEKVSDDFKNYAKAFYKWVKDLHVDIIDQEKTVFSEKYQYAGTCDLLVRFNKDLNYAVVDVKTGKDIYKEAFLQVSAYKHALEEEKFKIEQIGVLLLHEDGSFKYATSIDKFEGFLAAKKLYEELFYEDLLKVGYLKK